MKLRFSQGLKTLNLSDLPPQFTPPLHKFKMNSTPKKVYFFKYDIFYSILLYLLHIKKNLLLYILITIKQEVLNVPENACSM